MKRIIEALSTSRDTFVDDYKSAFAKRPWSLLLTTIIVVLSVLSISMGETRGVLMALAGATFLYLDLYRERIQDETELGMFVFGIGVLVYTTFFWG